MQFSNRFQDGEKNFNEKKWKTKTGLGYKISKCEKFLGKRLEVLFATKFQTDLRGFPQDLEGEGGA